MTTDAEFAKRWTEGAEVELTRAVGLIELALVALDGEWTEATRNTVSRVLLQRVFDRRPKKDAKGWRVLEAPEVASPRVAEASEAPEPLVVLPTPVPETEREPEVASPGVEETRARHLPWAVEQISASAGDYLKRVLPLPAWLSYLEGCHVILDVWCDRMAAVLSTCPETCHVSSPTESSRTWEGNGWSVTMMWSEQ